MYNTSPQFYPGNMQYFSLSMYQSDWKAVWILIRWLTKMKNIIVNIFSIVLLRELSKHSSLINNDFGIDHQLCIGNAILLI